MNSISIPPSLTSKLEQIKQYMSKGRVTAFVGAGFSLNAEMPSHVQMKTWGQLRDDFLTKLYGNDEEAKSKDQNDVVQLASLIDAEFKRNELDEILEAALPDKLIRPGVLHRKLMKLSWRDILTTNYDTLLERAAEEEVQKYQLVTNKETLLYQPSPRIIKLHGSFPNIRPYIMTKEDYRRYPLEHPEMVNTARQAFLESLICLIGFSGDDPNFQSWLGWLRDVIGKERICPTYLVTYNQGYHDAEKSLMAKLGIDIINLAEIPELKDFKQAYDFFLDYLLDSRNSSEWSGTIYTWDYHFDKGEEEKEIDTLVKKMSDIRKTYPGWIVLPTKYYDQFKDVNECIMFIGKYIDKVSEEWHLKLQFLYELDWRLSISCTPKNIEWYVPKINEVIKHIDSPNTEEREMINALRISLLQIYRLEHNKEKFGEICDLLLADMVNVPVGCVKYQQILFAQVTLDYKEIQQCLSEWPTDYGDYLDCIHKASVLIMMGNPRDAFDILEKCRLTLSKSWVQQGNDAYNSSCLVYVLELLRYIDTNHTDYEIPKHLRLGYTLDEQNDYCCKKAYEKHPEYGKKVVHNFKLGSYSNSWEMGGSGFVIDYLYPQRWFAIKEIVGLSFSIVDEKFFQHCIDNMFAYDWRFAWDKLLDVGNTTFVKETLTRSRLSLISKEEANLYFDEYIEYIDMYGEVLNARQKGVIHYSLVHMLGRLCSVVSEDRVLHYAKSLLKFDVHTVSEILNFIYDFLPKDKISLLIPIVLTNYDVKTPYVYGVPLPPNPERFSFPVDSSLLAKIREDISSNDINRQSEAYERCVFLWKSKALSEEARKDLESLIRMWRASNDSSLTHYSYNLIKPNTEELQRLNELAQMSVDNFCKENYIYKSSSDILSLCISNLEEISIYNNRLTEEQVNRIFNKIIDVIHDNLTAFTGENEHEMFFGGLRTFLNNIMDYISKFVCSHREDILGNKFLGLFVSDIKTISDKGYRCLPILVCFSHIKDTLLMTDKMKEILKKSLFSKEASMRGQTTSAIFVAWEIDDDIRDLLNHMFSVLKIIQDVRIVDCLMLIKALMLKGFDADFDFSSKVSHLLTQIYENINDFDLDADEKVEVCYHANFVAGIASIIYKDVQFPINLTFPYFDSKESGFNDVYLGYERGIEEAMDLKEK